ncbi:MAG TPA: hypothetical protein VK689_11885, partial [Armatimonadota bacterium]|nr:hypothetical protein [Armatimonadota bacterium]
MRVLRFLLALDSAVLILLGFLLIVAPHLAATAFRFGDLPPGVHYLVGLWGCALLTLGGGYLVAATDPVRHVAWIQVGIARGALECLLGLFYVARGIVTFQQAGFGIVLAG